MEVRAYHGLRSSLRAFCRARPRGSRMTRLLFLFLPLPSALFLSLVRRVYKVRVRGTIERHGTRIAVDHVEPKHSVALPSYRCSSSKQRELDDKKLILRLEDLFELIAAHLIPQKRILKYSRKRRGLPPAAKAADFRVTANL